LFDAIDCQLEYIRQHHLILYFVIYLCHFLITIIIMALFVILVSSERLKKCLWKEMNANISIINN
jgi:hypothetical protein